MTIPPAVAEKLLPFQPAHLTTLLLSIERHGIALDLSDTGTGKSWTAAGVCACLDLRPFFIGPKPGIPNLYRVCEEFNVLPLGNINYESIKNGKYYTSLEEFNMDSRVICPYIEVIREPERNVVTGTPVLTPSGRPKMRIKQIIWKMPPRTLIVYDEAHKGRNGKASGQETGNSKLIISTRPYLDRSRQVFGLFLSATMTDKLENFDVMGYMLGLYRPYTAKVYKQYLFGLTANGGEQLLRVHQVIFPEYASRMDIRAIKATTGNTLFKQNDFKAEIYEVDPATALEIEQNHQKIRECLEEIRSKGLGDGWARLIRYWQRIEVLKTPRVVQEIIRYLQEGRSVVVFVNFKATKILLVNQLLAIAESTITMQQVGFIEGGQTNQDRQQAVDDFQKDALWLLVCQIKAGGVALSLHHTRVGGRAKVSLIYPTWSATDFKQALGRIYRAGAISDAIQRVIYVKYKAPTTTIECEGEGAGTLSMEEILCRSVNKKLVNIELINNGDLTGLQIIKMEPLLEHNV